MHKNLKFDVLKNVRFVHKIRCTLLATNLFSLNTLQMIKWNWQEKIHSQQNVNELS